MHQINLNCGGFFMKKSMLVVLAGMLLALFSLSGNVYADSDDFRSFVLSNELGSANEGGLIDQLIAAGHGDDNLYEVLQLLTAQPGSNIPADFVTSVGNNLPGSEVFTATLSNFAGLNNPVIIGADGTLHIAAIFGRSYESDADFVNSDGTIQGVAIVRYTLALTEGDYIDTGYVTGVHGQNYMAIGIAWAGAADPASIPTLNEWGLILLSLAMAGAVLVYMKKRRRAAA
jgi:hypothetical protein